MSEEQKCKFCGKSVQKLEKHVNKHIEDANTPGATLKNNIYKCSLIKDYSSYTLYGKLCMLKKFMDIDLPDLELFQQYYLPRDYMNFYTSQKSIRNLYYKMMSDSEEEFVGNMDELFDYKSETNMTFFFTCFGEKDTYTEKRYQLLVKSILK